MNIIYIRSTDVKYDSRVQKEVNSLIKNKKNNIVVLSWDRNSEGDVRRENWRLENGVVEIYYFPILATWGGGMKKNFFSMLRFIKKVRNWVDSSSGFEAIHFCELPIAISIMGAAKKKRLKVVYDIYDYYPDLRKSNEVIRRILVSMENYAIRRADAIIICNEERLKQIGKAKFKKVEIIHNAPAEIKFGQYTLKSDSRKIKFVYIGNLVEERLICIVVNFFQANQEFELHIGGIGILSDEVQKVSEECNNIFYYGKMEYKDVLSVESQCDIIIALYDPSVPNHKYVAANKFYEALYLGKPLLMCKNTGIDRVIDEAGIGVTIEPNIEGLARGIEQIVGNKDQWPSISKKEKTLFYEKYSWKIMEGRLDKLYEGL